MLWHAVGESLQALQVQDRLCSQAAQSLDERRAQLTGSAPFLFAGAPQWAARRPSKTAP